MINRRSNYNLILCPFYKMFSRQTIFTFSYLYVEKTLFWGQILEVEILMVSDVLRYPESENHIFSVWSVCMCACLHLWLYLCVLSVLSVQNQHASMTFRLLYYTVYCSDITFLLMFPYSSIHASCKSTSRTIFFFRYDCLLDTFCRHMS